MVVLVDAEQHRPFRLVHQRRPVVQIAALFLPQRLGGAVRDGGVRVPGQLGAHAVQPRQLIHLQHDGQVDAALRHPRQGHRTPVLPTVTGVQDQRLLGVSGASGGGSGGAGLSQLVEAVG